MYCLCVAALGLLLPDVVLVCGGGCCLLVCWLVFGYLRLGLVAVGVGCVSMFGLVS